jgi:hypothetical protein
MFKRLQEFGSFEQTLQTEFQMLFGGFVDNWANDMQLPRELQVCDIAFAVRVGARAVLVSQRKIFPLRVKMKNSCLCKLFVFSPTQAFTVLYLMVVYLLILNFLLAIIVEAYMKVRESNEALNTEFEFFQDLMHAVSGEILIVQTC